MTTDETFMELAKAQATYSNDASRKTGCVIIENGGKIRAQGYNRFPAGVSVTAERLQRPLKYTFTEHAERVAIYAATWQGISLRRCTAYLPWYPCADCARALVAVGIRRLVAFEPNWLEIQYGFDHAAAILREGGVQVDFLPGSAGEAQ